MEKYAPHALGAFFLVMSKEIWHNRQILWPFSLLKKGRRKMAEATPCANITQYICGKDKIETYEQLSQSSPS